MKNSLYISSSEKSAGSFITAIGIFHHLKKLFKNVGFFRPIGSEYSNKIELMNDYFGLDEDINNCYGVSKEEASKFIAEDRMNDLSEIILQKYSKYKKNYDFVLLHGFNSSSLDANISKDININLAKNLNALFMPVLSGYKKDISHIKQMIKLEKDYINKSKVSHLYTITTRVSRDNLSKLNDDSSLFLRECPRIGSLSLETIKESLDCNIISSHTSLIEHYIDKRIIADMGIDILSEKLTADDLIIVSKNNSDTLLSLLYAQNSRDVLKIGAILLVGDGKLPKQTMQILKGINNLNTIILDTKIDAYEVAGKIESLSVRMSKQEKGKIKDAIELVQERIPLEVLKDKLNASYEDIMTPFMFEHYIFQKAKANMKNIILPESNDERILQASCFLQNKEIVNITLLGDKDEIINKCKSLGLDASKVNIVNPKTSKLKKGMIDEFYNLRKHKGLTKEHAIDLLEDMTYFATMMVQMGYADGMVSGAIHTTANTIRPALQIIKCEDNIDIVSSVFFMCMDTKVLMFGDCAINQNPNAKQLAQIAISSAKLSKQFGFEPKIAMMSYSSGGSGAGKDVEKVQEATKIVQENKDILVEGPLQYDSAIDKKVGKLKMPDSKVAGVANVLIFPDLNTGNNTYKAVQRSSNTIAIGPILQGLRKPVNDLSRGCNKDDIINTVVITALQAVSK